MTLRVHLLGPFEVIVDGVRVPPAAWSRRHAAALVKYLALAPGRRAHREQVLEALWPGVPPTTAAPRLHKAVYYARRALGADAVVSGNESLALAANTRTDFDEFAELGRTALRDESRGAADAALALWRGPLLPDDLYEPWTDLPRDAARLLHLDLLRLSQRWDELLHEDPADEPAHLAVIRVTAERGDLRGALRQFERMEQALRHELGIVPSREAQRVRAQLEQPPPGDRQAPSQRRRLVARREVSRLISAHLERAGHGRGTTLIVSGPAGVGKSAVLDLAEELAHGQGFRTGRGTASAVEGSWPYAAVLEALNDLCRKHPALLDGLQDAYRSELERALSGRDVSWSGESAHQRLFVAAAELVRLAAAGHGLMIVVDDVHECDDASLRLLHYLSRCAVTEPVVIVLGHRPTTDPRLNGLIDSLVARGAGTRVSLRPLSESATMNLLADRFPDLPTDAALRIWSLSGGLPFTALELARSHEAGGSAVLPVLPAPALSTFQRVALLGSMFSTDELLAVSGTSEDAAYRHLQLALEAMLVERDGPVYRFRHALIRDALLDSIAPNEEPEARKAAAEALVRTNAAPGRIAHQLLAAGLASRAVPYALRAVETAGALGAYRDALTLVDAVREHAGPDDLPRLLARRGDLLLALGDPAAVAAYHDAVGVTRGTEHRLVRARLARAASFAGDFDTARAALAGLGLKGDAADSSVLRAQGHLAYFTGDIDGAWAIAGKAREMLRSQDDPWHLVDLIALQGLIAHQRGEWFERFRLELRRTQGKHRLVSALFDAHLCVAEYLLYGPVPYAEVISDAEDLRRSALHAGALRGVAFANALIGEAALLMGDLERAEHELLEAIDLHRDVEAPAGEAHGLQRLAEVRLAQGDRAEANRLLQRALPLARWSVMGAHVIQRVYGTMIRAAEDPAAAHALADRAEATMGEVDQCLFCAVMLAVPAAIACADDGDLAEARRHLAVAESSAQRWQGTAWSAAVCEARAHVARAEGDGREYAALLRQAAQLFREAGQPVDVARCETELARRREEMQLVR